HHFLLRLGPVLPLCQPPDIEPFQERRQPSVLRPGIPDRGTVREQQLGPATPRLLLFAAQPFAQRMNQVVVGYLIVSLTGLDLARGRQGSFLPLRINGSEEANFIVENTDQLIELLGTALVPRRLQQFRMRARMASDVTVRLRQQGFQDST